VKLVIGAWAKNSTALDVLLGNSADMAAAEKNITSSTTDAVKAQGIWAGRTISTPAVTAAKRTFYAKKAVEAARATTAFELGNFAAFNSSQIFYPADATLTDQIKWAGAGYAIGGALEMATARYAVRSLTQAAIKEAGPIALDELSPVAKTADSVLFRPGKRGVGVTAYATMNADLNDSIAVNTNPATLKTNLYQDQVNINGIIKKQIDSMAYDTHEFIPRTSLSDEQKDVALKALTKNPTSLLFATKIGTLPGDGMVEFYGEISKTLGKAKDKLSFDTLTASTKFGDQSPEFFKAQSDNLAKIEPIQKAADEVHYVLEPTGEWTTYKNRADNWLDNQSFKDIKYKKYETPNPANQEENLKNYKLMAKGTNDITLHDDGRFELPSSPTPLDYSAAYAMGSKLIKDFKPVEGSS
jgi:hypothetical protein